MRSIYGFILLSGLLLTGVGNAAFRTFDSGSFDQVGSDIPLNILSENDGNFCKRGAKVAECVDSLGHLSKLNSFVQK